MAGLFDTLALGSRSLTTYRKAIDTTGHNLANVNTEGYTRQRVNIESVVSTDLLGPAGMGAEAVRVVRLHNEYIDKQLQSEASLQGGLEMREDALRQSLTALNETLSRNSASGTSTSGISQSLSDFFGSVQSLSNTPASVPDRVVFLQKAQALAGKFNQTDERLAGVEAGLNERISSDVASANSLLKDIADLNKQITSDEGMSGATANDLRDSRQTKLEALAKFIKFDSVPQENGAINVVAGSELLVDGNSITKPLETFDNGGGRLTVRLQEEPADLAISGGSLQAAMSVRDGGLALVREQINTLAATFITEVNAVHASGFSLTGSTGADLFEGTGAGDIRVNQELKANPALLQASSESGATGNNKILLGLAELAEKPLGALNGQSFSKFQSSVVAGLGQDLASTTSDLQDQNVISRHVQEQRNSLSGVSIDEEMANLVMFQKAFQASARLISMADEMLATIIQM